MMRCCANRAASEPELVLVDTTTHPYDLHSDVKERAVLPHDPVAFRAAMTEAGDGYFDADMRKIRDLRKLVQFQTTHVMERRRYEADASTVIIPARPKAGETKAHRAKDRAPCLGTGVALPFPVQVREIDCFYAAAELQRLRCRRVVVLNMANPTCPGGGWSQGAGAQEENLCRRSTLLEHLMHANLYPIPDGGCLYSKEVCVFRKSEADNYEFLPEPLVLDVVTAAAVPHPPLQMAPDDSDEPVMEPDAEETLARTLDTVLRACCEARADGLVFGAIGCGAFANPPTHVARLWRQALLSAASRANEIRQVIFAVFDDHNTQKLHNPYGNVAPFRKVFEREMSGLDAEVALES